MPVSEKSTGRRRQIAKLSLLAIVVVLVWVLFRMFEPVLTWSSGWQPLPAATAGKPGVVDPAWAKTGAQADTDLRSAQQHLHAPAVSAAIMIDGKRVWASAVGWADIANSRPVDLESSFRLGSTSKAVNAVAMGRLIDAGKLDVDRSVRRYVPDLPSTYEPVTTRLAVSHMAGIPDYGLCLCFPIWEHLNRRHFDSVHEALRVFEKRPLLFKPGYGFHYSSYGVNVVGAVIAAVAGKPYNAFVADAVLRPLHMTHSAADLADADNPHRVAFYEVREVKFKLADTVDNSIRYPSGGMLSTPSDMLALGNVFLGNSLLSNATLKQMLTAQKLHDGSDNPQGYALGIRVSDDKKLFNNTVTTRFYSHHGTAVGSTSYFAIYPEYGLVVSMMMNKGQENIDAIAPEATRIVELFIAEKMKRGRTAK